MDRTRGFIGTLTILVALSALIVSICSLHYTRREFVRSARPFVWAINFATIDNKTNLLINQPRTIGFRVLNAPARIISLKVKLSIKSDTSEKILFQDILKELIRYPDDKSQWTYNISIDKFNDIIQKIPSIDLINLNREIFIEYQSLDGGVKYKYELKQKFISDDSTWQDTFENGD